MNPPMNEPWRIQLFGAMRLRQSERVITRFRTQKTGNLLAFLAYHGPRSHSREVLIEMFWPDTRSESGRHNLSHALSSLRHQLEPPGVPTGAVLVADRFSVELNPEAFTTDVADFERALRTAAQARNTPHQSSLLTQAMEQYTGPLLPGSYEDWIAPEQERLAQRFQQAAAQLIMLQEKAGERVGALETARRAVLMDPLHEQANRELIRLLTATGQIEAALRQFHAYERLLEQELGETPRGPLRQMARQIEELLAQSRPPLEAMTVLASPSPPSSPMTLPTGTVTILMTDIEGSTALWEKAGEAFRSALSTHHALLRREFLRHGGQEVKEAGDAFLVVFGSVGDALACALACQRSLETQPWPAEVGPLRVRMALHTGDVELEAGEYHGLMLHYAARILAAAHGGQTLCSEATATLLKRDLDSQVQLKDLGVWRLRDVEEPERLFQAVYPQMATPEFPLLHASPVRRAHLPLQFTRFFGREAEIVQIAERLAESQTRLLTLTGPGGTGKTRLCIEAAGRFSETFDGAIWFVPLADLSDPGLIPETILHAMSLPPTGSQEPQEQLVAALTRSSALLLLDNFEQLVAGGGAEIVQTLLSRVPMLQCLVTSRQTLSLPGEVEFALAPLPTPNGSDTPEHLSLFESVRLFVDRGQAVKTDFRITNGNAPAVAELCDRLEGIPLAIELAAARALVLTPSQMLIQLGNRFEFLVSRKRGIVERQRTLRATMDWSFRLLSPDTQRFFAQLCVFRGGWTVEAAEAVCEEPLALDLLAQLRECSLVSTQVVYTQESESGIRFRMLETLREYAQAQLSEEEYAAARARHAVFFLELAEEAEPHLTGPEQAGWLDRLDMEHDNLRAALEWCLVDDEVEGTQRNSVSSAEAGLRLAGALWLFWKVRGYLSEGRQRTAAALSRSGVAQERTKGQADALSGAGNLAWLQGNFASARSLHEKSLALHRERGDKQGSANSLINLGHVARDQGDYASARSRYEESLALHRELGNKQGMAGSIGNLGLLAHTQGDYASARSFFEESLAIRREVGDRQGIALSLTGLGSVAREQGDYASARFFFEESLAIHREIGHKRGTGISLYNLGLVANGQSDIASARSLYEESLAILREVGDQQGIAILLNDLGNLAADQGDTAFARTLFAESLTIRQKLEDKQGITESLEALAGLALAQPQTQREAAADSLPQTRGTSLASSALPENV